MNAAPAVALAHRSLGYLIMLLLGLAIADLPQVPSAVAKNAALWLAALAIVLGILRLRLGVPRPAWVMLHFNLMLVGALTVLAGLSLFQQAWIAGGAGLGLMLCGAMAARRARVPRLKERG